MKKCILLCSIFLSLITADENFSSDMYKIMQNTNHQEIIKQNHTEKNNMTIGLLEDVINDLTIEVKNLKLDIKKCQSEKFELIKNHHKNANDYNSDCKYGQKNSFLDLHSECQRLIDEMKSLKMQSNKNSVNPYLIKY